MPINIKSIADYWARVFGDSAAPGDGSSNTAPARFDHYNSDVGSSSDTSATTDTGTFSLIALIKRLTGKFSASAALSDTDANPTTTSIGAKHQIWDGTQWVRVRQAVAGTISLLTGIESTQVVAQYLASFPTLTDTNWRSLLITARGELITSFVDYVSPSASISAVDSASSTATGQNSQSIISGTATAGSTVAITVSGDSSFAVKVGGVWVGTLQFERSLDAGTTWTPIAAFSAGTAYANTQITANGSFHGNCSSSNGIRIRAITLTSGNPIIQLLAGAGTGTVTIGNPIRLFDAISGVQASIKAASTPVAATDTAIAVDVRNYPAPVAQSVTIPSGSTGLSSGFALNSAFAVAIYVPSGWVTANITFQGSIDGGTTYGNLKTSGGSEVTINVTAAGDLYNLNPVDYASCTHLKIRSGTSGTPVNQSSGSTLVVATRGAI